VEVVRHQHVRVQRAAKALRHLQQAIEEEPIIVVSEETRLAIVPALDDVDRQTCHRQASTLRHSASNGCPGLLDDARKINPSAFGIYCFFPGV
jgi:hypothetical protein